MERLKQTSKLFLRDAEKDLLNQKYATCVIHLHMAAEHTLKAHLLKLGEDIEFKTLLEIANRLYIQQKRIESVLQNEHFKKQNLSWRISSYKT